MRRPAASDLETMRRDRPKDLIRGEHRGEVSSPSDGSPRHEPPGKDDETCSSGALAPSLAVSEPLRRRRPIELVEAASYLNVTERYVRRLVAERRITYLKIGRLLRFAPEDLDAYLEACRIAPLVTRRDGTWSQ